jgi:hypothetical protein
MAREVQELEELEAAIRLLAEAILALCDIKENPGNYATGSKWMKAYTSASKALEICNEEQRTASTERK